MPQHRVTVVMDGEQVELLKKLAEAMRMDLDSVVVKAIRLLDAAIPLTGVAEGKSTKIRLLSNDRKLESGFDLG